MRTLARLGVTVVVLITVVVLDTPPAWACDCSGGPWDEYIDTADAAFVGTVLDVPDPAAETGTWRFAVETVHAGELGPEVNVISRHSGPACGLGELEAGARHALLLYYSDGSEGSVDPTLPPGWRSSSCSLSGPGQLAGLGEPHPPDPAIGPGPTVPDDGPPWVLVMGGAAVLGALVTAAFVLRRRRADAA